MIEYLFTTKARRHEGKTKAKTSLKDYPFDAVLDEGDVEVDEKTKTLIEEPYVRQGLSFEDGDHALDGFGFDYNQVFDEEVKSKVCVQADALVDDGHFDIPRHFQSARSQFMSEACDINRFEQTRTKDFMNFEGSVHDLSRDGFDTLRGVFSEAHLCISS